MNINYQSIDQLGGQKVKSTTNKYSIYQATTELSHQAAVLLFKCSIQSMPKSTSLKANHSIPLDQLTRKDLNNSRTAKDQIIFSQVSQHQSMGGKVSHKAQLDNKGTKK